MPRNGHVLDGRLIVFRWMENDDFGCPFCQPGPLLTFIFIYACEDKRWSAGLWRFWVLGWIIFLQTVSFRYRPSTIAEILRRIYRIQFTIPLKCESIYSWTTTPFLWFINSGKEPANWNNIVEKLWSSWIIIVIAIIWRPGVPWPVSELITSLHGHHPPLTG